MKRDKFITIQQPLNIVSPSGGTRAIWSVYWSGWCNVVEGNYNTRMQEGQFDGPKGITLVLKKNSVTDKINTSMRIDYRGVLYLINSIKELDRFTIELTATSKEIPSAEIKEVEIQSTSLDFTIESQL